MSFSLSKLQTALDSMPDGESWVVALSGGLDSSVLLHALVQLKNQNSLTKSFRAVHINHGLQEQADSWQQHCEEFCQKLNVEFSAISVSPGESDDKSGPLESGIENAARQARYQAFEEELYANEVLLLAHHLDDQMETMLMRLMRGAGPRGLAGIPRVRTLGETCLFRPLLDFSREELLAYAEEHALQWVEDTSNADEQFDRNFTRGSLLPLIAQRWPNYRSSWSKSQTLMEESDSLLLELAELDLQNARTELPAVIRLDSLRQLSSPRQRNLLRHWLLALGVEDLGWNKLQQLVGEVFASDSNSNSLFNTEGLRLQCFDDQLHALSLLPDIDAAFTADWDLSQLNEFPLSNNGSLCLKEDASSGAGIRPLAANRLSVRYRQGGESCQLRGRPNKPLKKILQEEKLEPWLRGRVPLLYSEESLVCIPGIGVTEEFAALAEEEAYEIHWQRPDVYLS